MSCGKVCLQDLPDNWLRRQKGRPGPADPNDLLLERGQVAVDLSYRGDEVAGGDPNYPAKGAQRGGMKEKDWYYFTGLHISFRLGQGSERTFASGGNKKAYSCPKPPF